MREVVRHYVEDSDGEARTERLVELLAAGLQRLWQSQHESGAEIVDFHADLRITADDEEATEGS
jgi:hypothetical protein